MNKLDEYNDITQRLVSETVACCPESWEKGSLTIQSDGVKITYQLKNSDHPDKASISELLRDLIDELYVRMSRHGDVWTEADVTWFRENNNCKFKVNYVYPKKQKSPFWHFFKK